MEKKRKRASFSSNIPSVVKKTVPAKKEVVEEESEPVMKQVVEVVIESPRYVKESDVKEEVVEVAEETPIEVIEELPEEEEEVETKVESTPRITHGSPVKDQEEQQKETVAELFGKNSQTVMPEITVHKGSNTRGIILWVITMLAIAIGVGGGLVLFTSRGSTPQLPIPSVADVTPTAGVEVVTTEPTPTPKSTIKREDVNVQVLNGGGKAGAGSKMKAFLEEKGYVVTDVANATKYTYEQTEIVAKAAVADILKLLQEDLSETYDVGTMETTLPESTPYDVRVIVGK